MYLGKPISSFLKRCIHLGKVYLLFMYVHNSNESSGRLCFYVLGGINFLNALQAFYFGPGTGPPCVLQVFKIWNHWLILVSESNFFFNSKERCSALWYTTCHSVFWVMSIFKMEATSKKKILTLGKKMSCLEPKAVILLEVNAIYCF